MPVTRSQTGETRPSSRTTEREQASRPGPPEAPEAQQKIEAPVITDTPRSPSRFGSSTTPGEPSGTTTETTTSGTQTRTKNSTETAKAGEEMETHTIVPAVASRPASSAKSVSRRRLLETQRELALLELERVRAATALAKAEQELLLCEDPDTEEEHFPEDRNERVREWMEKRADNAKCIAREEAKPATKEERTSQPGTSDIEKLADAITRAVSNNAVRVGAGATPSYIHELPSFDGTTSEWLAFKTVYEDTAPLFSPVQNMARLRKGIKGNAREAVKSLLYSDTTPEEVMEALRRRFGRADILVLAEMEKLKMLPKLSENPRDVCVFASQVNNSVSTIRGLKKPQYLQSPEMVRIIIEKIPALLKYRWFDYIAERKQEDYDVQVLAEFLNREADRCGIFAAPEHQASTKRMFSQKQATHTAVKTSEAPPETPSCPCCKGDHRLHMCQQFIQAPMEEKWRIARMSRLCYKCLHSRHRKENCRKPPCRECRRWHHHLLHSDRPQEPKAEVKTEGVSNIVTSSTNTARSARAYLKMTPVEVYGPKGCERVLALMDEGSTVSLLDSSVAERIGASGPKEALSLETVGGRRITKADSQRLTLEIKGVHQENKKQLIGVRTIDDIQLTPQRLDREKIEGSKHLGKLADQLYYEEESPRLLIGQDNWNLIVTRSLKKGKPNQPVASLTALGWVLHGRDGGWSKPVRFVSCAHLSTPEEDESMDQLIKDHFAIESMGVQPKRPSTDSDARALKILEATSRRLPEGRFEAGLLWKSEDEKMPYNYGAAENRLKGIEKKLRRDPELKKEYVKQIQHLIDSDYAEEAPASKTLGRTWYLPHFAVTHPTKKKIRIVFDAAAKCGGKSLNDALLTGPDLLQSLFGVLLRFRQGPIAIVADIKEMFLQIRMREEDRDSLRFLWRSEDQDGRPKEYRMKTVVFGAASSPSTAIYVKNRNASEFKEKYPEAARAIERNHYMDDYCQSFFTPLEAIQTAREVDSIHRKAKFELRAWASNDVEVLKMITSDISGNKEVTLGTNEEKTLGLRWLTDEDALGFRTILRNAKEDVVRGTRTPTKREVTSCVMSTFDPMGLVAPVLIQGKKLLQSIWRSGVGWDESITPHDNQDWITYLENLQLLKELKLPRCISSSNTKGELHVFTDASETAFSAAVYWRNERTDGCRVVLIAAKARVTPLKPISIPRLELQAALLGSRLADSVKKELDLEVEKRTFWTDSRTVLAWIKTDPRTFKPFVAHRLAEIEDTTKPQEWRWVPSAQNPADDATRGIPESFNANHRWFTGPEFLYEPEDMWPVTREVQAEETGEEKAAVTVATLQVYAEYPTPDPARFSEWKRLLRSTARVLQFIDLCRGAHRVNALSKKDNDPDWRKNQKKTVKKMKHFVSPSQPARSLVPIEPGQMEQAERLLIERSQNETFREEILAMKKDLPLKRGSKLKKLDIMIEDEILKIRGRIGTIQGIGADFMKPAILDGKSDVARLMVKHYHERFNHGNHATVMNEIRQRYWVLGLRSTLRSIARRCQWCRVKKASPAVAPMGDLPPERLKHGEYPFTYTGVDYFGPMSVTIGRRHEKRWGVLFTCLTTRAVHLELAASLSSSSMIMALRRLSARRGAPSVLYSDNGTNFVGANRELKEALSELKKEELTSAADHIGIRWKFIPPGAPNMGGAWERLVRSVKTALAATLHEKSPREEVLLTLLLEAEHVINSRPLTELDDNDKEEALTPNHFLIGRSNGAPRLGIFTDRDLVGRDTWKTTQRLADHFWSRWIKEYLPTLLPRRLNGREQHRDLMMNDVVVVVDATLPRCTWPRGRVVQTYPGPDGRTRIVDVETSAGVLRRPSSKVVLLVPGAEESPSPGVGAAHKGENVGDIIKY